MLFYAAAIILVAILVCYLKMEVVSERSFTMDCSSSKSVIFEFLKTPRNLERVHPKIQEVSDIQKHNTTTSFMILEDFGALLGRRTFPMSLTTFCLSQVTSCINLNVNGTVADVTVTLAISDYETPRPVSAANPRLPQDVPSANIQVRVKVTSMRVVNYFISRVVLNVWEVTINSLIDLLQKEPNNLDYTESTNLH